jgi:hypothetical protein
VQCQRIYISGGLPNEERTRQEENFEAEPFLDVKNGEDAENNKTCSILELYLPCYDVESSDKNDEVIDTHRILSDLANKQCGIINKLDLRIIIM